MALLDHVHHATQILFEGPIFLQEIKLGHDRFGKVPRFQTHCGEMIFVCGSALPELYRLRDSQNMRRRDLLRELKNTNAIARGNRSHTHLVLIVTFRRA